MSRQSNKRVGLVSILLALVAAAAVVVIWVLPNDSGTSKDPVSGTPTAAPSKPSATQQYFNGISQAIKAGDLHAQSLYVANDFRKNFVLHGILLFPKGTTVNFQANTLASDAPNTGSIKATVATKTGTASYLVLLVKEKNTPSSPAVWHISDTEKVNG